MQDEQPLTFRIFEGFLRLWHAPPGNASRRRLFFLGSLLTLVGLTVFTGAVPTRRYGHDIFFLLDNGWRVANGQRPHVDYASAWGPVTFLIVAAGLRAARYSVNGVGYGSAMVGLLIGIWSYLLGRNRLESSPRILLSLFLAALTMAPYPLGAMPVQSSHAMVYNRYGYGILGLILLEAFQPLRSGSRESRGFWGAVSTGAGAAVLLFLKASYFLVSLPIIGVSVLFVRRSARRSLGIAAGFLPVALVFLAYLRFRVAPMLGDLRMAASARALGMSSYMLWTLAGRNARSFLMIVMLGFTASLGMPVSGRSWRALELAGLGFLAYAADILLVFSNNQSGDLPLIGVLAILIISQVTAHQLRQQGDAARAARPYYAAVLALGSLLFLNLLTSDVVGLLYGAWNKARPPHLESVVRLSEPRVAPLLLYDDLLMPDSPSNGRAYSTYINEGVALLRKHAANNERILTMDLASPFPYVLDGEPPLGGIACAVYNNTLSDLHRPPDDAYFGNADVVMVPKRPAVEEPFHGEFFRLYEPGLHERFELAAESGWWLLYRRKRIQPSS